MMISVEMLIAAYANHQGVVFTQPPGIFLFQLLATGTQANIDMMVQANQKNKIIASMAELRR